MKITDEQLERLLDENFTEYNYDYSTLGRVLNEVVVYIQKTESLVDISYFRSGTIEINVMLGDVKAELTESQKTFITDIFESLFDSKESDEAGEHYRAEREQDGDIDYDQFYFIQ